MKIMTIKFGAGKQIAKIEGESKSGKHWIVRRYHNRDARWYENTSKLKKDDYRILEIKEYTIMTNSKSKIEEK